MQVEELLNSVMGVTSEMSSSPWFQVASLLPESPSLPRSQTAPAADGARADHAGKAPDLVS